MTQNCTMKLLRYLICCVLLVACAWCSEGKKLEKNFWDQNLNRNNALAKADFRGIRDVWGKIRESAIATWNYVKTVGEYTKETIKIFKENVKEYAKELKNKFDDKLRELKNRVQNIINDIYGTGELIKQCTEEQNHMEDILKELMANMGQCIAEEINQLGSIRNDQSEPAMNQTTFVRYLDAKKELCENDMEHIQECLISIREEIFDNFTDMENKLLQNRIEARSIADDIKGTLVTCSISNLIDATNLLSNEIVEIAQCVMEANGNEEQLQENNLFS